MVSVVTNIRAFEGLSSDLKPTVGVTGGCTFTETDTGAISLFNGVSWTRLPGAAASLDTESGIAGLLLVVIGELGKIRRMTAIANELDDEELEPDSPMLS